MQKPTTRTRLYTWAVFAVFAFLFATVPAHAQYRPRPLNDPATGERFHVEAEASYWTPSADITFASAGFGIPGDSIDLKRDLGVTDQRFPALSLQLRPARSHHFRFQYTPIQYSGTANISRDLVF